MSDDGPNRDRAQDRAEQRKSERAETTESILDDVEGHLGEVEYPITGEEIAAEYGNEPIDMPNETESLGDVFDRLANEQFDSSEEVREAVYGEITGEAGSPNEANPERDLASLDEDKQGSLGESGSDAL
ncbi:DUF5789 family protein [Natronolimnohabitans innermongolicus]|uniref:DUF2795 domain-containing protein n=1 Tax=Natronolimnohabitans innermongolicus JCM 12255 TaxID=1227499 RepID=L9WSY1_9EURY|nr:hypothetical protein [Natronolimnohabitans innermongolicus]ELY52579.1 hypothetical protein C493_16060 [Natronolimnohabitans innermongolicus JCM 12255]